MLALGSNIEPRVQYLRRAVAGLRAHRRIVVRAVSQWRESAPLGCPSSEAAVTGRFLNGAVRIETTLTADQLLAATIALERQLGRVRTVRWGARTLDIDLLLYGDRQIEQPQLKLPHRWLACRRFVLEPAAELAPEWIDPRYGWSLGRLWCHLRQAPDRFLFIGPLADSLWQPLVQRTNGVGVTIAPPSATAGQEQLLKWRQQVEEQLDAAGWAEAAKPILVRVSRDALAAVGPLLEQVKLRLELPRQDGATVPTTAHQDAVSSVEPAAPWPVSSPSVRIDPRSEAFLQEATAAVIGMCRKGADA